jgi:hypothetical protein
MRTRTPVLLGGALLGTLLLSGCGDSPGGPSMKNSPEEMFEGVIVSPIPEDVSRVEGVGDMADTYYVWLRFRATDRFIDALITSGYNRAEWPEVELRVRLPNVYPGYHKFNPPWAPEAIAKKECYEGHPECPWSPEAQPTHYLVIDRSTGTVYFFGAGGGSGGKTTN